MNIEVIRAIIKARYFRLQSKADKVKRNYERTMSEDKVSLINKLYSLGYKTNRIACELGLTKEYVDAVCTKLH